MKKLSIAFDKKFAGPISLDEASTLMDGLPRNGINEIPWPSLPPRPEAMFAAVHSGLCFFLKYYVTESQVGVMHREINAHVHKDSCVEIFIGSKGENGYYNYEFNCLGVCAAGYGTGRHGRTELPVDVIRKIRAKSALCADGRPGMSPIFWELTLVFPVEVFCFHRLDSWKGLLCRGNFYKCGDELPRVHYLSWNNVISDYPDFHRPEFFGEISFE